jgi:hypothetical protein
VRLGWISKKGDRYMPRLVVVDAPIWTPLKTPVRRTRRVYLVDLIPVCSRSDS